MAMHFPALGRRGALVGMAAMLGAPGIAAPARTTPTPASSGDESIRVLVIGDSQAQGLAGGLLRMYRRDPRARVLDHSKISTGLSSITTYDWPATVHGLTGEHENVSLAMFGANDRPPFRASNPAYSGRLATWQATYSDRVRDIMTTLIDAKSRMVWVGHPIVRDAAWADDIRMLNDIFAEAASETGATFAPLWDVFAHDGAYTPYGPGADGVVTRLRADDGVHLTPAGYDLAAAHLRPLIETPTPG